MKKYSLFYLINFIIVFFAIIFLSVMVPFGHTFKALLISIPIILFQYPILKLRKNWYYKSFIFYLSMIVFLFIYGVITAWNQKVGANPAGTWLARADAGLRIIILGQLFGGFFAYLIISWSNYLMRDQYCPK